MTLATEDRTDERRLRAFGLLPAEYAHIVAHLGREPNHVELGMLGAMWSEHCGYKHSRKLLKRLPTSGPRVLQGPGENAGAVDIGDGLAVVLKMESHNHPSAVEPFQGAATGVGGILRDIFTMGARPIALLDSLRFGDPSDPRTEYLVGGVIGGIGHYGNCIGVPTVGGEISFDASYSGNPIVNAMCVGVAPIERLTRAAASGPGNPLLLVGADTGRDGLQGAAFASNEDPEASHRGVVQVGNPFLEKLLLEACLAVLETGDVLAMQDLGAAGLTSSAVEMAARGGLGVEIDVARVPRRETGLGPFEVMLSESQERMLLLVRRGRESAVEAHFAHWDLHAKVVGQVTDDGQIRVRDGAQVVAELPIPLLTDEVFAYDLIVEAPPSGGEPAPNAAGRSRNVVGVERPTADYRRSAGGEIAPARVSLGARNDGKGGASSADGGPRSAGGEIAPARGGLGSRNDGDGGASSADGGPRSAGGEIAAARGGFGSRNEGEGGASSADGGPRSAGGEIAPLGVGFGSRNVGGGQDVGGRYGEALLDLLASPNLRSRKFAFRQYDSTVQGNTVLGPGHAAAVIRVEGTPKGLAMSTDCNPRLMRADPRRGAAQAVAEAARNLACVGAEPIAVTDCLNFGNPEKPLVAWQLTEAIEGLAEACRVLDVPIVSGNVSLYNETAGRPISPTPAVGMVGLLQDVSLAVPTAFTAGTQIIILGDQPKSLGASEYAGDGAFPRFDLQAERRLALLLRRLASRRLLRSAQDVSDGGLAVAVAECALVGGVGATLDGLGVSEVTLFSEDQGRAIVTCQPEAVAAVLEAAAAHDLAAQVAGSTGGQYLTIGAGAELTVSLAVLRAAWETAS